MKKTIVALAALTAVGGVFAQSSVSITGLVGAAYQSVDNSAGTGSAARGLTLTNADIKLTAVEDLGGGLKAIASVVFETPALSAGPAPGLPSSGRFGQGLTRSDTTLGLTGSIGTLTFANTRSTHMLTRGMVAPANLQDGIYDTSGIITRVGVDALTYSIAPISGFTGFIQLVEDSNDGNVHAGVFTHVIGVTYANGPMAAGVQFKRSSFDAPPAYAVAAANIARTSRYEAFATYDLGVAKLGVGYDGSTTGVAYNSTSDANAYSLGLSAPVGAITVGFNWAKRDVNSLTEYVVKYDLSKRTSLNASFGKQTFDAAPAASTTGVNGQQYRVGLYHAF